MKKEYSVPEIEITTFDVEDIITLSNAGALTDGNSYDSLFN